MDFDTRHSLPQDQQPSANNTAEPYSKPRDGCRSSVKVVLLHEPSAETCIDKKTSGTRDHGTRFESCIRFAIAPDSQAQCRKCNRRRSAEKPGKTFGHYDIAQEREQRDDEATDDKSIEDLLHLPSKWFLSFQLIIRASILPNRPWRRAEPMAELSVNSLPPPKIFHDKRTTCLLR
jgi:hypothetical protein